MRSKKIAGEASESISPILAGVALSLLVAGCWADAALAAPAAYWRWRSAADGQEFCTQTPPGPGWTQVAGPFRDLQCREPGSVPLRRWAAPPQRTP
ncbi:MAG: hypothetical protein PGN19_09055 [Pseudomonas oryzihabitans]